MNTVIDRFLFTGRRSPRALPWALIGYAAAGAGVALLAWYPGQWLALLLVLPWLWRRAATRGQTLALWAGYYLVCARDIPAMCARFFPGYGELSHGAAWALGALLWLAQGLVLAAPWAILRPTTEASIGSTSMRTVAAVLLVSVPPLGIIGWVSPLHVASALFPGWGVAGLMLGIAALCAAAAWPALSQQKRLSVAVLVGLAAATANLRYAAPAPPTGWRAIDLALGRLDGTTFASRYARSDAVLRATAAALKGGARVVILPEEIIGAWRPSTAFWWQPLAAAAKAAGQTVVLGADIISHEAPLRYTDSALLLGAGAGRLDSRQPMPAGLWRPGAAISAQLGALDQPYLHIGGRRAAVSICFEDFLWWPHWKMLVDPPDVLLSLANGWFNSDLAVAQLQRQSIASLARLTRTALLRAVNR